MMIYNFNQQNTFGDYEMTISEILILSGIALIAMFVGWLFNSIDKLKQRVTVLETQYNSDSFKDIMDVKFDSLRSEFKLHNNHAKELAEKNEKINRLEMAVSLLEEK